MHTFPLTLLPPIFPQKYPTNLGIKVISTDTSGESSMFVSCLCKYFWLDYCCAVNCANR
jgi:hypothetical protein